MKKLLLTAACLTGLYFAHAQDTANVPVKDTATIVMPDRSQQPVTIQKNTSKVNLGNRSNDHLMLQYGFDNWAGTPDSISPKGFSRFFNAYIMLDQPFKTNPKFSVGLGVGIGSSNIFFKNTYVDVKSTSTRLPFTDVDSANHFKKFKLTTIYLEAPVELRYSSNPENTNKSVKAALGIKVGTMLKAYTKGKNLLDKNGSTINSYIEKESSKRYFNSIRFAATARVGYGIFGLYAAYQITSFLKDTAGPGEIRPYSIGIYISGL